MPAAQDISRERDLLEFVYSAFNRREIDAILPKMHSDVEWPNGIEGGWVHGHEGVRAYWTRQWSMIDPHVEPLSVAAADDARVTVRVHQVVRHLTGVVLADRVVEHVYTISDGMIQRMEIRE
jgi:hypothetical protein